MSNPRTQTSDELESVEAQNSLFDLLYDGSARAAATRLGQFVYRRVDSLLSIVEKTARWSLPQPDLIYSSLDVPKDFNISAPPLIRPLPWLLFLPALIALRLVRVSLSFLALMIGKPPVYPVTVVAFLQNKRRKLRALKYRGQRLNRITRAESQSLEELPTWLNRVTVPIGTILSTKPSKKQTAKVADNNHHEQQVAKKRNAEERDFEDSDDSFEDADCMDLLDKYANIADDSSFNVEEASDESSDSSISETDKSINEAETTEKPSDTHQAGSNMNGHTVTEIPVDLPALPNIAKESEKILEKSSLNITKDPKVDNIPVPEKVEKAVEAISANGTLDPPVSVKQDAKNNNDSVQLAKTTLAAVAPEAVIPAVISMKNNNNTNKMEKVLSGGEGKGNYQQQHKIKQPQPAPLQPQNFQQPPTITANGGSGGRKQKRPQHSYS